MPTTWLSHSGYLVPTCILHPATRYWIVSKVSLYNLHLGPLCSRLLLLWIWTSASIDMVLSACSWGSVITALLYCQSMQADGMDSVFPIELALQNSLILCCYLDATCFSCFLIMVPIVGYPSTCSWSSTPSVLTTFSLLATIQPHISIYLHCRFVSSGSVNWCLIHS